MLKHFLKFIEYYGKDKKIKIFFFIIISVFAGFLELVGIGLIYPFLLMIINPQTFSENLFYTKLSNLVTDTNSIIILFGILIVLMFLSKNFLMIICTYLQNKFVINWKNDINRLLMSFYINSPYKKLFNNTTSEKIYNLTVLSSQTLETFVLRSLIFTTNLIIVLIILSTLLFKFTTETIFTIIFVGTSMFSISKIFKQKTEILAPKMLEYSSLNNNQIIENIKNLKEIRIFNAENYFMKKFENIQYKNNDIIFKNSFYSGIPPYIIETILVFALIFFAAAILYKNSSDSSKIIASYGFIIAAAFRIAPSLNRIQVALNHINSSKEMLKKMNEEYEKNEFKMLKETEIQDNTIEFKDSIELKNINFEYVKNVPILKDINLKINKGEFVGIVGASGAGKTTLADVIIGLLPPDSGSFYVDNQIINENNVKIYRKLIGYVPQETNILQPETYKNNVAWGINEKEINEELVKDCLKKSQIYDFVEKNGGINSEIKGLSQGQKQRLSIARALYKNSEIIVFDEATSSLDVETESEINELQKTLSNQKTVIVIAHRLKTIKECDKLIYLKEGKIIDIDSFEGLKNKYPEFEKLINLSKI